MAFQSVVLRNCHTLATHVDVFV